MRTQIAQVQRADHIPDNVLFHLSVPPPLYGEMVHKLGAAALLQSPGGWRRIIIEKPFGHDAASARALDRQLLQIVREEQLYRVDHYLGKETVQNMLVFRFANPGFEPIWNHHYIDHVQITVAEAEGIGTRAGYYDATGVLRDMVQNHLLQLLCMTAMEPPVSYDSLALRNETAKVLQAIRPLDVQDDCVVGQYGRGTIDGCDIRAYREEEHVAAETTTPTFAALKLTVDNWRWARVPFYVRTGKRLPQKRTDITIQFKPTPHVMFPLDPSGQVPCNSLTFRLQPNEGIQYTFLAKQPGPDICLRPVTMRFRYDLTFGIERPPSAYEWLLHDAMQGHQTLFARSDWIYDAWAIVDPVIPYWDAKPGPELPLYPAGTRPDRTMDRVGVGGADEGAGRANDRVERPRPGDRLLQEAHLLESAHYERMHHALRGAAAGRLGEFGGDGHGPPLLSPCTDVGRAGTPRASIGSPQSARVCRMASHALARWQMAAVPATVDGLPPRRLRLGTSAAF